MKKKQKTQYLQGIADMIQGVESSPFLLAGIEALHDHCVGLNAFGLSLIHILTGYEKGIAGHEVVAIFDNIKVLKPTGNAQYQGFQILMSGKGCRNYENFLQLNEETWFDFLNRVCQYHINVPRIDLAIDDRKPYLSIADLIVRTKEGLLSSKLREIDFHDSGELKEEVFQSKGGSLYLGSSASNLRLVFYEKGYEQNKKYGTELDANWNRYELRFRQVMAVSVVQELLRYSCLLYTSRCV